MNKHPNAGIKCERCGKLFLNDHAYPIWCVECLKAMAALKEHTNKREVENG